MEDGGQDVWEQTGKSAVPRMFHRGNKKIKTEISGERGHCKLLAGMSDVEPPKMRKQCRHAKPVHAHHGVPVHEPAKRYIVRAREWRKIKHRDPHRADFEG